MQVHVKLFGPLREHLPLGAKGGRAVIELPEGATVDTLAEQMGFGDLSCVVMVNDEQVHRGMTLHAGDHVSVFPPLAGG